MLGRCAHGKSGRLTRINSGTSNTTYEAKDHTQMLDQKRTKVQYFARGKHEKSLGSRFSSYTMRRCRRIILNSSYEVFALHAALSIPTLVKHRTTSASRNMKETEDQEKPQKHPA